MKPRFSDNLVAAITEWCAARKAIVHTIGALVAGAVMDQLLTQLSAGHWDWNWHAILKTAGIAAITGLKGYLTPTEPPKA